MPDIFISYSQKDKFWVSNLEKALEEYNYTVWRDSHLEGGCRFDEVIWKNLENAKCVIVVWSKHSFNSHWVRDEADEARKKGNLIPIRIDDVRLRPPFSGLQTDNFSNKNSLENIETLLKSISIYAPGFKIHAQQKNGREKGDNNTEKIFDKLSKNPLDKIEERVVNLNKDFNMLEAEEIIKDIEGLALSLEGVPGFDVKAVLNAGKKEK